MTEQELHEMAKRLEALAEKRRLRIEKLEAALEIIATRRHDDLGCATAKIPCEPRCKFFDTCLAGVARAALEEE